MASRQPDDLSRLRMFNVLKSNPDASDVHVNSADWTAPAKPKKPRRKPMDEDTTKYAEVIKVDESLGIVLGWAMVCKLDGEPYFDVQGDHIPEDVMLKATVDFMAADRIGKEMHRGEQAGTILFAWPLTSEIAKAMSVTTEKTGLMIGYKPSDKAVLAKFKDQTYRGFSIGGRALREAA